MSSRLTRSPEETEQVGAELAEQLLPGDVVLLRGELGTGKTTFVRGAVAALGLDARVKSPTFTLGVIYEGTPEVAHLDLYRLSPETTGVSADLSAKTVEDPGIFDEYLDGSRIIFIEWPQSIPGVGLPQARAQVLLEHLEGDSRSIEIHFTEPELK